MSQVAIVRTNAILPFKAAMDLTGQEGRAVTITNGDEITLCPTADTKPFGLLIKGGSAGETVSVAIPSGGFAGTVRVKLGEPVAAIGRTLELTDVADGCLFKENNGAKFGYSMAVALDTGLADEKIEAVLFPPAFI